MSVTQDTDTIRFLSALYGGAEKGFLCIFTLPDSRAAFFPVDQQERAVDYAINARDRQDVYFGIGLQDEIPESGRGKTEDVIGIPGAWLDVDVQGPAHKSDRLPPSFEAAEALINEFPLKPSLVVHSGHGLQPHWLFKELWMFGNDDERQKAASLVQRFQTTMQRYAAHQGYAIDTTHDLARVLRLPGTYNRKQEPMLVTFKAGDDRYNPDDFLGYLADTSQAQAAPAQASQNEHRPLGRPTLEFVANGAPLGQQRNRAVAAARAYLSAGYSVEETAGAIWRGLEISPQDGQRPWAYADALQIAQDLFSKAPSRPAPTLPQGRTAFPRTDSGNAELFAHLYGHRSRYDHRRKRWLLWQGHWWASDSDGEPTRLAKAAARRRYERAADIQDLKERQLEASWAIGSENRARLDAALALAQAERPIASAGDAWDLAPWLLGVGNGVFDLRTGSLRPGRPEDGITFHAGADYVPDAKCPRWLQFLEEIFGGDQGLIGFMKRSVGYALTGDVSEQVWWLLWGSGSNGKGLFLNTQLSVLGLYAANTPFTTFEARDRPTIPSDLAALAGKRFVTASETNEGVRLNEARLKAITGGDPITARFLFGEFFTYRPALKLFLAVNHRPIVKDDSPGFWRRMLLIPFTQSFIGREDKGLSAKLLAEAEGILAWAVEGCTEWQEGGLRPPQSVLAATQDYRARSDSLTAFLTECCEIRDGVSVQSGPLYNCYSDWMKEEGRDDGISQTAFGTRMAERFEHSKGRPRIFFGVGLKALSQATLPDPCPSTGLQTQNDGLNGFSHKVPPTNPSRGDLLGNAVEPVEQIQKLVANPLPQEEPVAPAKQAQGGCLTTMYFL